MSNIKTFESNAPARLSGELVRQSNDEQAQNRQLYLLMEDLLPRFGETWNRHYMVTLKRQSLSRLLYYNQLYQKIIEIPGVICEFGVQWGATMVQLINMRGIYEPYNHSRRIVGFDTFEGFPVLDDKDGSQVRVSDYATGADYVPVLNEVLQLHEAASPLGYIKKFDLVKGDASQTFTKWLDDNPAAIISMAIFDMDIYKPTKDILEKITPRLTKGAVLVFDELNCPHFPGETEALREVLGLGNLSLRRFPHQAFCAWAIWGE